MSIDYPVSELFAGVVGQPAAVAALRAAAVNPVHAYLFCGPPGSGRRAAANGFAAALLCPQGGCGECTHCRHALAGTHPDLVVIERTGAALSVAEARRVAGLSQRRPLEAERQVLVVTDIQLALRSAPALLKTLEDTSRSTVFVLLGEHVPSELATVASRCVEIPFPPVPLPAVEQWLVGQGVDQEHAHLVAEGSGGDLNRARLLAGDATYGARLEMWLKIPAELDGTGAKAGDLARSVLTATEEALEPLRAQHAREIEALTEEAKSLQERGIPGRKEITDRQHREERRWRTDELRAGLGVLSRVYRDRLGAELERAVADPAAEARRSQRAVGLVGEAAAALIRNPNETLLLQALFVRLGDRDAS